MVKVFFPFCFISASLWSYLHKLMEIEGIRIKRFNLEKEISTAPQLRVSGFSWLVSFLLSV